MLSIIKMNLFTELGFSGVRTSPLAPDFVVQFFSENMMHNARASSFQNQEYPLEGVYVGRSKISVLYDIYKH